MKRLFIISLVLLAVAGAPLGAQDTAAVRPFTLNDCLIYARDNSHANRINSIRTRMARVDKHISAASLMPSLDLQGSGNISFGRNIDPGTNTYDTRRTLSTAYGLYLSIPLFDGLVSINNLRISRIAELKSIRSRQIQQDLISLDVIKAFYNVDYCRAMVAQMQAQLRRDSTDLVATRRGEQLGVKSGADVAELAAVVATDIYELANQRNLLDKAWLQLRGAMGMELSSTPFPLDTSSSDTCSYNHIPLPAPAAHPRIAEAELSVSQSALALRAAKGAYSPRIALNAGISSSYYRLVGDQAPVSGFGRQFRDNMGQYVGISVAIPIFNGLANVNRVRRARLSLAESRIALDQTIYEIDKATAEARLDLHAAIIEYDAAARRLEAEKIAYQAMRRKYDLGSASVIDLYTTSAKLANATANLEGKRVKCIISRIVLGYYYGHPLISRR